MIMGVLLPCGAARLHPSKWILAFGCNCYHMMHLVSAAHAEQRIQALRLTDVPTSLFGEERHCLGAWSWWWSAADGGLGPAAKPGAGASPGAMLARTQAP